MYPSLPAPSRGSRRLAYALVLFVLALASARSIANFVIDYQWWKELDQVPTWIEILLYSVTPVVGGTLLCFGLLLLAHWRGLRFSGIRLRQRRAYVIVSTLVLLVLAWLFTRSVMDAWTVVRYFGGKGLPEEAAGFRDAVFGLPLKFYLFELPFYGLLRRYTLGTAVLAAVVYWATARGWQLVRQWPEIQETGAIDTSLFRLTGGLESRFIRTVGAIIVLAVAFQLYLGRYEMLWNNHGFMVGVDYVDEKVALPLQWLAIVACLLGAGLIVIGRWKWAAALALVFVVRYGAPPLVSTIYVKPNEISIQRPYIERHIQATRSAFGLTGKAREVEFDAQLETRVDVVKHKPLLDNVRLWDWRAFHDTVTQIQALRPYYVFADTDVDRYVIDGQLRQVLLTPRELDIRQLADARVRWINPHFIYTHGYGMVMAEANRITTEGLPVLFVQDAPPQVRTRSLKLTRPEIYYGEVVHEPVFVRTAQPEFSYPSGAENVFTRYEGTGGFPIHSFWLRVMAAIRQADYNILLTQYLTPESRMMIRRNVRERLNALANFIAWDPDPYLVLTEDGRLVWTVDGYTVSAAHPYASSITVRGLGTFNYIRNSVKATIDAYHGTVRLYIFDPADPIIQAYQRIFPRLFLPASQMPPDLRFHVRYPETLFRAQAEIYRTFHMTDPQAFYNKEDVWDIARNVQGQDTRPQPVSPVYVVATLPGQNTPEFLLILPFTPRNKDNMIGLMVARCDGEHLGELVFLQLSKQELIFGPMQIEARVNQDQVISKDLTLWNQQGSQVLRGQMLVLPIENSFLYVEPIYIQAAEARMPQLRKVVLAMGNILIYRDTYEEALAELAGVDLAKLRQRPPEAAQQTKEAVTQPAASTAGIEARLEVLRQHLRRYRELAGQGRWVEAGRELEALEAELQRR